MEYKFLEIKHCNMCGDPVTGHKVLGRRMNTSQGLAPRKKVGIATTVMKCRKCTLIYTNPQPIPGSIHQHYNESPEEYWTMGTPTYFSEVEGWYYAEQIANIKRLLANPGGGARALDIGAGFGKCMVAFERAGFEAYGIEPSVPFYKKGVEMMNGRAERLQNAPIEEASYPEDFFDVITFGAVLEHLIDPSGSIKKALSWLKPTGIIHIEVPSSDYLFNKLFNAYFRLIGTDYVGNLSPMHSPFHLYEFGLKSFQENGRLAGYEIAHSYYQACPPTVGLWLHKLIYSVVSESSRTGMQLTVYLRKNAGAG